MDAREARLDASIRTPFRQVQKAPPVQKAAPAAGDDGSVHGHAAKEAPKGAKKVPQNRMHAREARLHASVRTPFRQVQKGTPGVGEDVSIHRHAADEPPKVAKKVPPPDRMHAREARLHASVGTPIRQGQKAALNISRTVTADAPKKVPPRECRRASRVHVVSSGRRLRHVSTQELQRHRLDGFPLLIGRADGGLQPAHIPPWV
jgi:hypothetical protein